MTKSNKENLKKLENKEWDSKVDIKENKDEYLYTLVIESIKDVHVRLVKELRFNKNNFSDINEAYKIQHGLEAILNPISFLALDIAYEAHKGQKDLGGRDYILHPINVAILTYNELNNKESEYIRRFNLNEGDMYIAVIVALFHDIIEDTDYTYETLKRDMLDVMPFSFIETPLKAITHIKGKGIPTEDYETYIKRCDKNDIGSFVKIMDLVHNSDLSRLKKVTKEDLERNEKYKKYIEYLNKIKRQKYGEEYNDLHPFIGAVYDLIPDEYLNKYPPLKDLHKRFLEDGDRIFYDGISWEVF